jgi:pimeloyl-ACP methyl ester carboxylesterase
MNFTAPYLGTITARTLIVHSDRDALFPLDIPIEMHRAIRGSALWMCQMASTSQSLERTRVNSWMSLSRFFSGSQHRGEAA